MTDKVVAVDTVYGVMRITLLSGQAMTVPKAVFRLHPLKVGESVREETYWQAAAKAEYELGMQKAVRALTARERTQKELERSLQRSGYREDTIARIVGYLVERRYVDDERYANQLAQNRQRKHSARRITQTMQQKGIERSTIESALARVEESAQQELLDDLARKYVRRHPDISTPQERNKAIASLVRRGFDFSSAREALRKAQEDI
ncbi:MAG: regulatory protein RecX [Clostridiales bacterium]|nr:regulatory protein RecX [Clostridiales bacterium]